MGSGASGSPSLLAVLTATHRAKPGPYQVGPYPTGATNQSPAWGTQIWRSVVDSPGPADRSEI